MRGLASFIEREDISGAAELGGEERGREEQERRRVGLGHADQRNQLGAQSEASSVVEALEDEVGAVP
jgi:hypothetical protein